jgi:hypothetical protein
MLFPGWKSVTDTADVGKTGSACDRLLVHKANALGVHLITNEQKPNGTIAVMARKAGVTVVTPREFWQMKDAEDDLTDRFLENWAATKHVAFRRALPKFRTRALAEEIFGWVDGYYRHVLLGETRELPAAPPTT